jgi:hypothetical protein
LGLTSAAAVVWQLLETITPETISQVLIQRHKEQNMSVQSRQRRGGGRVSTTHSRRYTAIGPVLIAVNPYKLLKKANKSIYHDDIALYYFNQNRLGLLPHVFKVAAEAYVDMRRRYC